MQKVERVLPPEGEFATAEVPEGEEDGFPPEEEIAHARARESFLLREEGEESALVAQGHVPEREYFFSCEEGEESVMAPRSRASDGAASVTSSKYPVQKIMAQVCTRGMSR